MIEQDRSPQGGRHAISRVLEGSIAQELGIEPGDALLSMNGQALEDIFDYQYQMQNSQLEVLVEKADGEQWILGIEKDEDEDLGLEFAKGLLDDYRSCCNRCVFCFIDQLPRGMRRSLYFKDDDSRLSFLQGNYITLTNLTQRDVDKILRYRLSPINISFHTTNPKLRCQMLGNARGGSSLDFARQFYQGGISMNGQIVLCKGINDGEELERSIGDLSAYLPYLDSLSVVPVGLSRHRQRLTPLEAFGPEDAREVLDRIHRWQEALYPRWGKHFVHAGDEWYILAGLPLPPESRYDGYPQWANGVGMMRAFLEEFDQAMEMYAGHAYLRRRLSLATGLLARPFMEDMAGRLMEAHPGLELEVVGIENRFFGHRITVSGLLTGQDVQYGLEGRDLGEALLLPENVLRSGEPVFLDDMSLEELELALQVPVIIVKSSGYDFVEKVLGIEGEAYGR